MKGGETTMNISGIIPGEKFQMYDLEGKLRKDTYKLNTLLDTGPICVKNGMVHLRVNGTTWCVRRDTPVFLLKN